MAWESVVYMCGHEGEEQMYGHHSSKDSKVMWIKEHKVCPECWKMQLEEKRKAEYEESVNKANTYNLPPLEGSEKQIIWAEKIRADIIDNNMCILGQIKEYGLIEFATTRLKNMIKITDAKNWIDNRDSRCKTYEKVLGLYEKHCAKQKAMQMLNIVESENKNHKIEGDFTVKQYRDSFVDTVEPAKIEVAVEVQECLQNNR